MLLQPYQIQDITTKIAFPETSIANGDHLYIFGRNPVLALAELQSLYNQISVTPQILALTDKICIVQKPHDIDTKNAGTVLRKAIIMGNLSTDRMDIALKFPAIREDILFNHVFLEEKCNWAISTYNFPEHVEAAPITSLIHDLLKKGIKKQGIRRAFYLSGQESRNISPRRLKRKKILEEGMEIILFYWKESIIIGVTKQVIDVDGFAKRDDQRPHRRPLLLLGLAVARAMINLTSLGITPTPKVIYDPFCGMGSIVGEAYCLGYTAYGSDIDGKCVTQTQENLQWLSKQKQYHVQEHPLPLEHIFPMDIEQPDPSFIANFAGSLVAEPNLLTPLESYPTLQEARDMMEIFENNYFRYFQGITKLLQTGQIGVLIFPRIHTNQDARVTFDYQRLFSNFGFTVISVKANNVTFPAIFVHAWKKHIIEREIVVFRKR
jgi:tRNA G10  N-methylase Trm11